MPYVRNELLKDLRHLVDDFQRNGIDTGGGGILQEAVNDFLEEVGFPEENEFHEACGGDGCIHCNFGRVRQPGDPINPQGSPDPERPGA